MQAAVVQVVKPHWARLVDLCDPTRVMVMDDIFLAWWAWHVLLQHHLRPASSHRTAVYTVLRRLWPLRIWPWATSHIHHPTEDIVYHRRAISRSQVLHLSRRESSCFHIIPSQTCESQNCPRKPPSPANYLLVWMSEFLDALIESVECGFKAFSEKSPLFPCFCLFLRLSWFSSLPAVKARGWFPFISKKDSHHVVGGAEEVLYYEELERTWSPSFPFLLYRNQICIQGISEGTRKGEQMSSLQFCLWITCFMNPFGTETQEEHSKPFLH